MNVPPFPADYRSSGVLLHVTSLPSPYGIGDFGPTAVAWIDRLHDAAQSWWQLLPLGPLGYGDSPYQALSAFAGNVLLISPEWLIEDGLVQASDCSGPSFCATCVDFEAVREFKSRLLDIAWKNFRAGRRSDLRLAFEQFGQDHARWLDDYALFRALRAKYEGAGYLRWPEPLVRRVPEALDRARRDLAVEVERVRFAQYLWFRQAKRLHAYARAQGVALLGDLPFFVSPESSDVWSHPELFLLDEQHRPRVVAGVPPTTSAHGGSCGAIPPTIGTRFRRAAISGGSTGRAPYWLTWTRFDSIISADSRQHGTYRPQRRRPNQVAGCQAPAPVCLEPCTRPSMGCHSWPRIWVSSRRM